MPSAGEYQSPADAAAFQAILENDPASKRCFECDYPNAPWCDINHGIFICLDCSGTHRGLGVHLSFVRSSTMDGWAEWRPEKLRQMQVGGNTKARAFFDAKGVPKAPIRERYNHVGAIMYKDKLEADAAGRPFDEAAWQAPEWANGGNTSAAQRQQQQQQARFQGHGNSNGSSAARGGGADEDWLGALSSGWSTVASNASKIAASAATVTVAGTQQLASTVQEGTRSAPSTDELAKAATETAAVATTAVSSAWGALASWTNTTVTQLKGAVQQDGGASAAEDEDGLSSVTRNLAARREASPSAANSPASPSRLVGVEHQASPVAPTAAGGLSDLAGGLPRGTKYEGIGSSPNTRKPTSISSATQRAPPKPPAQEDDEDWGWGEDEP